VSKTPLPLPPIGDLELAVLEYLWVNQEADVVETHAALGKKRGISANTVGSALERLCRKGLLSRAKLSNAYRYRPSIDREGFRARRLVEAAGGVRALSERGLLAAFVEIVADSDRAALGELERLIEKKRKEAAP
jgi:predicted transcriptional regulator